MRQRVVSHDIVGQGENVYTKHTLTRGFGAGDQGSVCEGLENTQKRRGGGAVSPFQDEQRDFGLELSEAELAEANELGQRGGQPAPEATPGLVALLQCCPGRTEGGASGGMMKSRSRY